ncbi:DUF4129 domain-containing protein [Nocardioidaceae bacterium]|nr:DUF4129 domain-containing protein [Nocardioidaceae bacterium]
MLAATVTAPGALLPDPGPARDLLRRELSGSEYRPTLLEQARDFVFGLIEDAQQAVAEAGAFNLLTLTVAAVALAVVLLWLLSRLRPETRARAVPAVLGDSTATAAEHRDRARAAYDQGRFDDAVREALRGLARDLEQRPGSSDVRPGSTAREVGAQATRWFPDRAGDIDAAVRSFEDVVYGDRRATPEEAERALRTGETLAEQQPRPGEGASVAAVPQ